MSRRTLFRTAGMAAVAGVLLSQTGPAFAATENGVQALIERRRLVLTGGPGAAGVPELAAQLAGLGQTTDKWWQSMDKTPARTSLWNDIPLTGIGQSATATANMGLHFNRIYDMALGYSVQGSPHFASAGLAADLVAALQFLNETAYKPGMKAAGNWWFWEIGAPRKSVDILTLLHAEVPEALRTSLLAAVRWFAPNPNWRGRATSFAETGANRVDKSLACCMRGILDNNPDEAALGRDALSDTVRGGINSVFGYVNGGDGFYTDGSYVQHTYLPYAGTYGVVALAGIAEIFAMLGGSPWAVTDPKRSVLLDAIENTYAPFVWDGRIMDTVRGRAVSRQREPDYVSGFGLISAVLLLAPGCEEPYRSRFLSLAKGWLERCADQKLVGHPSQSLAKSLLSLSALSDASVAPAPAPVYSRMFADQDRLVHHRPQWGCTVNLSSKRIGRYEWGNSENNLGWYQGDGMTFVYTREDPAQFSADFWPTVDPYGLPGTTVNDQARASGAGAAGTGIPRAFQAFAGGLTMDSRWGVVGMDHLNHNKTLSGRKSWFFLDDAVVCLGAGITGTGGASVQTTVENRSFAVGSVPDLRTDSRNRRLAAGDAAVAVQRSVHVDGHGGYVFLDAPGVSGAPEVAVVRRTGSWFDVNSGADTGGSKDPVTRDYVTVTHRHGVDPADSGYAYMVLPAASHDTTFSQSANPGVKVLANSADCQMVDIAKEKLVLANFFATGTGGGYAASGPCTVAIRQSGDALAVSVADPSRTQSSVRVTLPGTAWRSLVQADAGVALVGTDPLVIDVQLDGHGHQKNLTLGT
ncbi:polysaccharide lyase 8 family protein [Arthrobacter sp. CJ23]|uniref:polysaccharide lyase 8 family protein n=1 Tax=Arthrobacter sp. CJ23 TaxID=2972479 RepID=UPI00215BD151|nr:polysaccharide lyase 8 family protein [Arthrobacter sp. CJ23]UVJ38686.1 polysaccharide lyase 8 family protein [Arthrobacter sp. CJ23]